MKEARCQRCGYSEFACSLEIHHKDINHSNDFPINLITLCKNCHQALHRHEWCLEDIGLETPVISKNSESRRQLKRLSITQLKWKNKVLEDRLALREVEQLLPNITIL